MTSKHPRPTAPHLQVYKLPLTAIISISHRITGVFLTVGLVLAIAVLIVLAQGEGAYLSMQEIAQFWLIKCLYWVVIFALFFHLCHGVRHLFWDFGISFEREALTKYALFELLAATAFTLITAVYLS